MRGLNSILLVSFVLACSDDGAPADGGSEAGPAGTAADDGDDDDDSATNPTATNTDPTNTTPGEDTNADGTDTVDDGSGSTGGTSTASDGTSAGSDGSSSDDTGPAPGTCDSVADCIVVEDCCNCTVASASDPPTCDIDECRQSACDALGFDPAAQCELGSCEPFAVPCDPDQVSCESVPPDCQDGFFPGVDIGTECWTGGCVPADACETVPSCDDCPEGEACVEYITHFGPQAHCSPIPADCGGAPSCGCMPEVCVSPFDTCADGPPNLSCSCAVCG